MKKFNVNVNGTVYSVEIEEVTGESAPAPVAAPVAAPAVKAAPAPAAAPAVKAAPAASGAQGGCKITAPMPGTVVKVAVSVGQSVKSGETVVVLESMKMENDIVASKDGVVASVNVGKGTSVQAGDLLISLN